NISNIQLIENDEDDTAEFSKAENWKTKANLNKDEFLDVAVIYKPANQVPDTGSVVISSNDPENTQLNVPIRTPQLEPSIFSPPVVQFSRVPAGQSDWQITQVQNIDLAPL